MTGSCSIPIPVALLLFTATCLTLLPASHEQQLIPPTLESLYPACNELGMPISHPVPRSSRSDDGMLPNLEAIPSFYDYALSKGHNRKCLEQYPSPEFEQLNLKPYKRLNHTRDVGWMRRPRVRSLALIN